MKLDKDKINIQKYVLYLNESNNVKRVHYLISHELIKELDITQKNCDHKRSKLLKQNKHAQ